MKQKKSWRMKYEVIILRKCETTTLHKITFSPKFPSFNLIRAVSTLQLFRPDDIW